MDGYDKLEKIGEGTYGKVYKAKNKITGQLVAIKKNKLHGDEEGIPPSAIREISLLQALSQDNSIVKLLDVEHAESKDGNSLLCLVFEYMDCDLKEYIKSSWITQRKIAPQIIKSFMYQICKGVAYCHSHSVMHRDLKPHNLLVDKEKSLIKIADLGLGRAFTVPNKEYTHQIVTLWYRAPEILLGATHYSTPVDMWSVGCIFAEMSRMQPLFTGDNEISQLIHIFRYLGTPNEEVWPGVTQLRNWHLYPQWKLQNLSLLVPDMEPSGVDLLSKLLIYDPSKRISAKRAMQHPYFDDLDKSQFSD